MDPKKDFSWRAVDLTGQRFGRLTVWRKGWLEKSKWREQKQTKWECMCDCGNYVEVYANNLRKGTTRSCGCLQRELAKEIAKKNLVRKEREDLTNRVFGRLTVTGIGTKKETSSPYWVTKCLCGNVKEVRADKLRSGKTKSCGCLRREPRKSTNSATKQESRKRGRQVIDLTGKRFGRLVVQSKARAVRYESGAKQMWICQCDCGYPTIVYGVSLKSGDTKSCGCLKRRAEVKKSPLGNPSEPDGSELKR